MFTLSEERKDKIRQQMIGVNNHFYGKSHSEETIAKIKNTIATSRIYTRICEKCKNPFQCKAPNAKNCKPCKQKHKLSKRKYRLKN